MSELHIYEYSNVVTDLHFMFVETKPLEKVKTFNIVPLYREKNNASSK